MYPQTDFEFSKTPNCESSNVQWKLLFDKKIINRMHPSSKEVANGGTYITKNNIQKYQTNVILHLIVTKSGHQSYPAVEWKYWICGHS